jgi:hypothetical protein
MGSKCKDCGRQFSDPDCPRYVGSCREYVQWCQEKVKEGTFDFATPGGQEMLEICLGLLLDQCKEIRAVRLIALSN